MARHFLRGALLTSSGHCTSGRQRAECVLLLILKAMGVTNTYPYSNAINVSAASFSELLTVLTAHQRPLQISGHCPTACHSPGLPEAKAALMLKTQKQAKE